MHRWHALHPAARHCDDYRHGHRHADADPYGYSDAHPHGDSDPHRNGNADSDSFPDQYADTDCDHCSERHYDGYRIAYPKSVPQLDPHLGTRLLCGRL